MTIFGRKIIQKLIFAFVCIMFIAVGMALVKSLDNCRFQSEKLSGELKDFQRRLDSIEARIASGQYQPPALGKNNSLLPFANAGFFDRNAVRGGKLVLAEQADSKNLNIIINNDASVSRIWDLVNCPLAARNYDNPDKFEPFLAESWNISEDRLVYTINLRKGVLWQDFKDPVSGKEWKDVEVTADDIKFYVDVIKDPDVDCAPSKSYYKDIDRIEVIDKYKFKVYWKNRYFLSESITLGALMPLPRHFYRDYQGPFNGKQFNDDFERNKMVVGCGPYRFDRWEPDKRIVLKKWDKYFGDDYGAAPSLDNIVIEIIGHPNTQFQALLSGDIGEMALTSEQWINRTNTPEFDPKDPRFMIRRFQYPDRMFTYIGYNERNPLFADKKVRQAMTSLVDREKLLDTVYSGLGKITSGPYYIYSPYYDSTIKPYPFSVDRARELLKEAGWKLNKNGIMEKDGRPFEFTVLTISSSTSQEKMFPIIKEDMKKVGVIMNINKVEWSVLIERLDKRNFDAVCLAWALPLEDDPFQLWHSSMADVNGSSNHIGFKNKDADDLINQIRTCFDQNKRIELCHKFHRLLHEEQPYTFLFCQDKLVGINKNYNNVRLFREYPIIPQEIMWISQ